MRISKKAADAYALFKRGKKIRTYGKLIKESIDEDTRSGGVMKLGIRGMLELAGKVLGTSLTSHPYFTFHKVHLEALAQSMNASSNHDQALKALNRAIRSADASAKLTSVLASYQSRKNGLRLTYAMFIAGSLNLLRDYPANPQAAQQMKETRQTPESLKAYTEKSIDEWRALWCELYLDSVGLLAMGQVELRATQAAMEQFEKKMNALSTGGSLGRIAALSIERDRQWQQFDRLDQPGTGSAEAVENPTRFAQDQLNKIEKVSDALGECLEAVMSEDAYRPTVLNVRVGSK